MSVKDRALHRCCKFIERRCHADRALSIGDTALPKMLAPVLAFTADEAWEQIPGKKETDSVHLAKWEPASFPGSKLLINNLRFCREEVLPELEKARQSKLIGKSLDAKVIYSSRHAEIQQAVIKYKSDFKRLLGVSQLEIAEFNSETPQIVVSKADGQKCERCWHWETDIGQNTEHPTICGRCVEAVVQSQ